MTGAANALISCRNLRKTYPLPTAGDGKFELLFPDIVIPAGRRIALLGVSGSGKSTLLNLIAGLDTPDTDQERRASILYQFSDGTTADMADRKWPFPRDRLGFVFQEGHLITDGSAGINAALPGLLNGISGRDQDMNEYMDALKLPEEAAWREAWRLSGGQKQRVALLRALFHQPQIIFADEPTSSLDKRMAEAIMRLLVKYQELGVQRSLFWATHDLQLAAEFATDLVIVRKPEGRSVELEGPIPNPGSRHLAEIERKVYDGATLLEAQPPPDTGPRERTYGEVPYTQAKLGSSLTFARRDARQSLFQSSEIGRWMASIEARRPPVAKGLKEIFRVYRRFSDYAVAGAITMSMLMLGFVFLGLTTMKFFRDQAMSDPTSCNIVASAPDAGTPGSITMELTPSLITLINDAGRWRGEPSTGLGVDRLMDWIGGPLTSRDRLNPCGGMRELVFGRNTTFLTIHLKRDGQCIPLSIAPKALAANLAEPAILATDVKMTAARSAQKLGDLIPQGQRQIDLSRPPPLTGDELFVTEALREQLKLDPSNIDLPSDLTALPVCVPGREDRPIRIGGIISGLPQPRGLPYMVMVGNGSPWLPQFDSFEQAAFYTHPERADELAKYLTDQRFAFSRGEIERLIAASHRFAAINQLIWMVGGIMIIATFLFLLTCIGSFLEKNARPNAVLRAYGLTKRNLKRQIYWRLATATVYALGVLLLIGSSLGAALYVVFSTIGLPLPTFGDALTIFLAAFSISALLMFVVVEIAVSLWWRRHENIAQELN
jgi:ABC-type lipoprotein export system ATPase subunit